ncbi:MAG TPA: AAA family ATPase, partial [bacterium]|nr:AAA family ATPase [bacterium]
MAFTIAVAGKGGTGKTTIASLVVRYLVSRGMTPVLGVDADPNSNLAEAFDTRVTRTIGDVLGDFVKKKPDIPPGMTKESYLEVHLNSVVIEGKGMDFIVMGRKHGPGCYCYPNVLLKNFVDKLASNYRYVVMDNEAGMEHVSRKNVEHIDLLLLVSDHTARGLRAALRINTILDEMGTPVKNKALVINRFDETNERALRDDVRKIGVDSVFKAPFDEVLGRIDVDNTPVMS